jgi:hypothetical protein
MGATAVGVNRGMEGRGMATRREEWRIPDAVHYELLNWSRWCWIGEWPHPLPATHCGSLESQYRAPAEWGEDAQNEAPRVPTIRPNERQARLVQSVYDRLEERPRLVLRAEYPARHASGRTESKAVAAARLGMPVWAYDDSLMMAVRRVEDALAVRA